MKKNYTHLPKRSTRDNFYFFTVMQDLFLTPFARLYAQICSLPGITFHKTSSKMAYKMILSKLRGFNISLRMIYSFLFRPIDTVRYFEFGSAWQTLSGNRIIGKYLDVSSPRLLPLAVLQENPQLVGTLLNPNKVDLVITEEVAKSIDLKNEVRYSQLMIEDLDAEDDTFDLITSISVLEHIEEVGPALEKIWGLLKKGGCLIISMPCSKKPFEEYVDFDEYQLSKRSVDEFIFGQRFYSDTLLHERVYSVLSKPTDVWVYGEKAKGWWFKNRNQRIMLGRKYSQWREPIRMIRSWKEYFSVDELPGVGVVILKFRK